LRVEFREEGKINVADKIPWGRKIVLATKMSRWGWIQERKGASV
jgi:hypothetical protein